MKSREYIGVFILVGIIVNQFIFLTGTLLNKDAHNEYMSAVLPSVLVEQTNERRLENNLSVLNVDKSLVTAAQNKANDMAEKGYFSHDTPEGFKPWKFLDDLNYSYVRAGENLAVNFLDSEDVTDAWMRSVTHRDNILNSKYSHIGIATAKGKYNGRDALYVVQFFATPNVNNYPTYSFEDVDEDEILASEYKNELAIGSEYTEEELLMPFTGVLGAETVSSEITQPTIDISNSERFLTLPVKVTTFIFLILFLFAFLYGISGIHIKSNNRNREKFSISNSDISIYLIIEDYRYLKQGLLLILIIMLSVNVNSELAPIVNII